MEAITEGRCGKTETESVENTPKGKRYYWLKLPQNYFSHLDQKKMKKHEHGKDMQIVYLRMMLLSIDKGGCIYYQGVFDSLEEELAEEFDEPVEIIRETLEYLKDNNMIAIDENSDCFVPESLTLTGSEGSSAERVRRHRNNQKMLQSNVDVTDCNGCVTSCNVEKEIELEKEKKKEKEDIVCPEPDKPVPDLSGILLPLVDKSFYDVPKESIQKWRGAYPAVDVEQQLKRMIAWLEANPKRRKTRRGINTFINTWLAREQDKGGRYKNGNRQQGQDRELTPEDYELPPAYREMYEKHLGKRPPSPDDPF